MKVSKAFEAFAKDAPQFYGAWMDAVEKLGKASKLDAKTQHLSYIAVLAAVGLENGLPFHTKLAKSQGVSREEIISAILVGLPAVGNKVTSALPIAIEAYDENAD
ncbi:MAG: carboxymuconolactone decarboxylase family protein [Elusimicrobiota bacterium]|jgi:alkylhydroperoxidase/carboxymuconolactone decarboxylase family protein YurZ|nr:carboxymuconolactone decarboxylase family protein [Elusimicrobiota bacterium]